MRWEKNLTCLMWCIGCRAVHHANGALPPISSPNERVLQIISSESFILAQQNKPFNTHACIVPPLQENSDWMTWHDRGAGTHNPE
eukprot:204067-Amphidinium_carterae.1